MSPLQQSYSNTRVYTSKASEHLPPNKDQFRVATETLEAPILKENEVFVKNLIFSMDPYLRFDFKEGSNESPVIGVSIARVLDSKNPDVPVGALAITTSEWAEYSLISHPDHLSDIAILDQIADPNVPLTAYNGVLGVSGLTAWDSLNRVGDLKKGETIYISSAAGTLGQIAGQLAKRKGLRVIGSAGSDEKVAFLKNELGFDGAFNYKTQDKRAALTELVGEAGLDIYFDLVGDDTTEVVLDLLNFRGRVLAVGILALHQNQEPHALRNVVNILVKQLRYEGYTLLGRYGCFPQFWQEVAPLVAKGEIKYTDTVLKQGVETLGETYIQVLSGAFKGKVNVQIADL